MSLNNFVLSLSHSHFLNSSHFFTISQCVHLFRHLSRSNSYTLFPTHSPRPRPYCSFLSVSSSVFPFPSLSSFSPPNSLKPCHAALLSADRISRLCRPSLERFPLAFLRPSAHFELVATKHGIVISLYPRQELGKVFISTIVPR